MASAVIGEDRLAVLSEALQEGIAGRKVRAAVFTTFTFDPGFFELHVLPNLFDRPFHQVEKIRRVQLEDALRSTRAVAAYYDAEGISNDASPAHLDFARIAAPQALGCFHPKLILVLVEDHVDDEWVEEFGLDPPLALLVGTLSANLTRAGWWENVETGHFEELRDRDVSDERCSYRRDLLSLLKQLRAFGGPDDDHAALDMISAFVRTHVTKNEPTHRMHDGRYYTRLFHGQQPLADWLVDAGLRRFDWNLEVISPYFDSGEARVLRDLVDAIQPNETRVFLPRDHAGDALVTPEFRDSVSEMAAWSDLPAGIQQRGGAKLKAEATTRRRVHAKVYRFWSSDGREVLLTGSVNLTSAALCRELWQLRSGILRGRERCTRPAPVVAASNRGRAGAPAASSQRSTKRLRFMSMSICGTTGVGIHSSTGWTSRRTAPSRLGRLPAHRSARFQNRVLAGGWYCQTMPRLRSANCCPRRALWLSTIPKAHGGCSSARMECIAVQPLLQNLSPEEILRYWSLLSDEQRSTFIERRLEDGGTLEGLQVTRGRLPAVETVFDRVAGVFHAFERQYRRLSAAIGNGEMKEAQATLFGRKYDSLPVLLQKITEGENRDAVMSYLTFLCARQLLTRIETDHPAFIEKCGDDRAHLIQELDQLGDLRDGVMAGDDGRGLFLEWYEEMFGGVLDVGEATA